MEQMERIRDQQESLAKLHFELGAKQEPSAPLSEEGLRQSNENTDKLMERLERLSDAIGQLNPSSVAEQTGTASAINRNASTDFRILPEDDLMINR